MASADKATDKKEEIKGGVKPKQKAKSTKEILDETVKKQVEIAIKEVRENYETKLTELTTVIKDLNDKLKLPETDDVEEEKLFKTQSDSDVENTDGDAEGGDIDYDAISDEERDVLNRKRLLADEPYLKEAEKLMGREVNVYLAP